MGEYGGFIDNKEVGKRIKEIRESHQLTQEQLAEILKVTPVAVRDYEKGKYGISKEVMLMFKQHFHVSIDVLLFGESTEQERLLSFIISATEQDKMRTFLYLWTYFVAGKKKGTVKRADLNRAADDLLHLVEAEWVNE